MSLFLTPKDRLLVVGMQGEGKSEAVKAALRSWLARGVRCVVADLLDEYSRHGRALDGLVCLGPMRDRVTARELAMNPGLLKERRLSLSVVPSDRSARSCARLVQLLVALAPHAGRCALVVDEVHLATNPSLHHECHRAAADLSMLAATGRHDGVALVMISQRTAGIPKAARATATHIWAYKQTEPEDLDALAERFRSRELADQVAALQQFERVEWSASMKQQSTPVPALRAIAGEKT